MQMYETAMYDSTKNLQARMQYLNRVGSFVDPWSLAAFAKNPKTYLKLSSIELGDVRFGRSDLTLGEE